MSSETRVYYRTNMTMLPNNCIECPLVHCNKPMDSHRNFVLKAYHTKRHEDCPLMVIGIDLSDQGDKTCLGNS